MQMMGQREMTTPKRVRVKRVTPFTLWLGEMLRQAELSQSEFARRAGLGGPAVVSRWLSGEAKPSIEMCRRIAAALQVDIDFVLEKAGYRPVAFVGETSERGGLLAAMAKRINWDDETRYATVYRILRSYQEEDRLRAEAPPPRG